MCAESVLTLLCCHTYDTAWIFTIADFVNYLWGIDDYGTTFVQICFYPR